MSDAEDPAAKLRELIKKLDVPLHPWQQQVLDAQARAMLTGEPIIFITQPRRARYRTIHEQTERFLQQDIMHRESGGDVHDPYVRGEGFVSFKIQHADVDDSLASKYPDAIDIGEITHKPDRSQP